MVSRCKLRSTLTGLSSFTMSGSYFCENSVNDGIDPLHCSLVYITVENAAQMVVRLGRGTLLAKLDIQSAYRIVPVHPADRALLGMRWSVFELTMLFFVVSMALAVLLRSFDCIHLQCNPIWSMHPLCGLHTQSRIFRLWKGSEICL